MVTTERQGLNRGGALIIVATALMAVGVVMVTSATARLDASYLDSSIWRSVFGRQIVFAVAGLILLMMSAPLASVWLTRPGTRRWGTYILTAVALLALTATFLPNWSHARHGSSRWVSLSVSGVGFGFQPSELAKIALIVLLAWWFAERDTDARSLRGGLLPAVCILALFVILVGKEDFSTSFLLAAVGGAMLLVAGCRIAHLAMFGAVGVVGMVSLVLAAPYRMERLVAFRTMWEDSQGAGYQPLQSLTAIASGGWLGTGLGAGIQKYSYLPESHSDFILALSCEETGALGGALIILLFVAFVYLGLRTMWQARSSFERLIAFGLTACVGLQAVMNIAVVLVLAPTTGIPLPLVSAGGSGVLTCCLMIGVLVAIARRGDCAATATGHDVAISFLNKEGGWS